MKHSLDIFKIIIKQFKVKVFLLTFANLGVISSLVGLLASVIDYKGYGIGYLGIFFIFSLICSLFYTYNSLKEVKIKVGNDTNLTIRINDLFKSDGVIVIPMDEYFYPKVDGNRISHTTLHGMFINRIYKSNTDKLRKKLDTELCEVPVEKGINDEKKYPIGKVLNIEEGGKDYMLLALSRFKEANGTYNAYLENTAEYLRVIDSLLEHIHGHSQGRKTYIPLIGTGLSRVNLTKQEALETFINKLKLKKDLSVPGGIEIVIYKGDIDEVNFKRLKAFEN